jgi:hypothetical protein
VAVAVAPLAPLTWRAVDAKLRRAAATLPSGPQLERSVILVLNTASFLTAVFAGSYRLESGKAGPPMMHILGSSATPVRMTRLARNTIELEPEGGYLVEPTSQLVRQPNRRFAVGDAIFLYGPRITIAQITHDGRPKRIRADLIDAEDARMLWVTWNDRRQRFDRVTLPPVGASLTLQGSTDPLTMQ